MRRYGIHLNGLRAFEAAARLSSFSRAGIELNVSHSTISHHIKGLEKALGVDLFARKNRRVELTHEAETLYRVLNHSFDEISAALEGLARGSHKKPLSVTVTPSFANKWLIPNLRMFRQVHPEIDVQVKPSLKLHDFSQEKLDIGVRNGLGKWRGLDASLLMPVHMTPLCAPSLLEEKGGVINIGDIRHCTLIHADVSSGTGIRSEWSEWLSAIGVQDVDNSDGLSVQDPGLALQAAIDGLGIAMGYLELAAIDLKRGRLIQLFETTVKHPWSYYIVTPEDNVGDSRVKLFREWLEQEAGATIRPGDKS